MNSIFLSTLGIGWLWSDTPAPETGECSRPRRIPETPPRGLRQPPGECSFGDQTSCPQNTSPTQQYTVTHLIKTYFANSLLEKLHGFEHDLSLFLYCVYNFNFNIINHKQKTKAFSRLYKYIYIQFAVAYSIKFYKYTWGYELFKL